MDALDVSIGDGLTHNPLDKLPRLLRVERFDV